MKIKILFLVPYPLKAAPSQRFRFEQYFDLLRSKHYEIYVSSFLSRKNSGVFSTSGKAGVKLAAVLRGFSIRCADLVRAISSDFIFIHREATPIGPPVIEWILKFILHKKVIYDFDDAIWLTDKLNERSAQRFLKWRKKTKYICRWSYKVSCSNEYLREYALRYNREVILMPTTVDTVALHNPDLYPPAEKKESQLTIGWTGSFSTLKYLQIIEQVITEIQREHPNVRFLIIADRPPLLSGPSFLFKKWSLETEVQDLSEIDIGVMPLPDDAWTQGKSGFKCLQYMALRIPSVASNVGLNTTIIDHGINGYLASSLDEWKKCLVFLIKDARLRKSMGEAGREKVVCNYSVTAHSGRFLSLFK